MNKHSKKIEEEIEKIKKDYKKGLQYYLDEKFPKGKSKKREEAIVLVALAYEILDKFHKIASLAKAEGKKEMKEIAEECLERWEENFGCTRSEFETHSNSKSFDKEQERINEVKALLNPNNK